MMRKMPYPYIAFVSLDMGNSLIIAYLYSLIYLWLWISWKWQIVFLKKWPKRINLLTTSHCRVFSQNGHQVSLFSKKSLWVIRSQSFPISSSCTSLELISIYKNTLISKIRSHPLRVTSADSPAHPDSRHALFSWTCHIVSIYLNVFLPNIIVCWIGNLPIWRLVMASCPWERSRFRFVAIGT
jgi:hypothetical protein